MTISVNPRDLDAMVRTVYGEARGEPAEGQDAVTWVIINRYRNPSWWGATPYGVCHKPEQFSCWNADDPNSAKLAALSPNDPGYKTVANNVSSVLAGVVADPTNGATHYKVTGTKASWDAAAEKVTPVIVGHHSFYKLGPHA